LGFSPSFPTKLSHNSNRPTTTKGRAFRPDVEGLRAVAVLVVLLDHAGLIVLDGGYVGVDVFFN
jgi:peptidoglycan/LPS O-acetylase OafA/YrhL